MNWLWRSIRDFLDVLRKPPRLPGYECEGYIVIPANDPETPDLYIQTSEIAIILEILELDLATQLRVKAILRAWMPRKIL